MTSPAPAFSSPLDPAASPPSLLVVDDEAAIRMVLSETFLAEGYEVATAADAFEALEILTRRSFSAILSDNHMPRMQGLDFLARARALQPNASRILITGIVDLETLLAAINRGEIYRFVIKPWVREELLATIRNAAQRHDLLAQNQNLLEETQKLNVRLGRLNVELERQLQRELEQNRSLDRLNQALTANLRRSVALSLHTLETFYPTLGNRAKQVLEHCRNMSKTLQLSPADQATLEIAAQLHDVGLLGVPRELIKRWQRSPASLNDVEIGLIKNHPVHGEEMVNFMDQLESVGKVVRAHHEHFDGSGYPDRISGDAIPWLSRLLAVAIAFVETEKRGDEALIAVKRMSGGRLDPEAVRMFLRSHPSNSVIRGQREVLLSELAPGMTLAQGVHASNGLLLIPEGQTLSRLYIDKLFSHHRVNPIKQSLLVYC
ncbi:MAG: response regulator [Verrucomicrobia bacterium]|nr:response regulator [Verrucomicrobiota bacterium]MBI3870729.1 response regulator [Verrucomicrobiota bacterium]